MKTTIDTKLINIIDGAQSFYGADQKWFARHRHRISGCGPVTAALITMYMAQAFADKCAPLYPHDFPAHKEDFTAHMEEVRKFVCPGLFGLTDTDVFSSGVQAFAKSRGVRLMSQLVSPKQSTSAAFGFLQKALAERYLPALLILRNPFVADFAWHWMAVTGCDSDKQAISVSSYGKEYSLSFENVWQQKKPYYAVSVYFYPM